MNSFLRWWIAILFIAALRAPAPAQTTKSTTEPPIQPTTESTTKPTTSPTKEPTTQSTTAPSTLPSTEATTQSTTAPTTQPVKTPAAPAPIPLSNLPEGAFLPDLTGRLIQIPNSLEIDFQFEKDGKLTQAPILPNLELMRMENAIAESNWQQRFHASARITEYQGRNYILLEHASRAVAPATTQVP